MSWGISPQVSWGGRGIFSQGWGVEGGGGNPTGGPGPWGGYPPARRPLLILQNPRKDVYSGHLIQFYMNIPIMINRNEELSIYQSYRPFHMYSYLPITANKLGRLYRWGPPLLFMGPTQDGNRGGKIQKCKNAKF